MLDSFNRDYRSALVTLGRSRAILERLWQENLTEPSYQSNLAECYSQIGTAHARLEEPEPSLAILDKARAIHQGLVERYPENLAYKKGLAENLNMIGFAQYKQKDNDAALKTFLDVQDICQKLLTEVAYGPKPSWLLNLLALSKHNIGNINEDNGDIEKALQFYEEALKYRSDLVDLLPSVTQFREKLAVSYREIAELQRKAHRDAEALPSIRKSIEVYEDLVRSQPDNVSYHKDLAWMHDDLGLVCDESRNNEDAMSGFAAAVRVQRVVISKTKQDDDRWVLSYYLDNLGEQYVDLGRRPKDGLPYYEESLRIRRGLSRAHPDKTAFADDHVKSLFILGNLERHLGEPAAAREMFGEARTNLAKRLSSTAGDRGLEIRLAAALGGEAEALAELGQPETAKPLLEEAAARLRKLVAGGAPDRELAPARAQLSETLWDLARVFRDLEPPLDAEPVIAERNGLWKTRPPEELIELALKHLSQATVIGYGKMPLSAPAEAIRDLDFDQAAGEVVLAVSRGLNDLDRLKSSPESPLLLSRADVKAATRKLEPSDGPPPAQPAKNTDKP